MEIIAFAALLLWLQYRQHQINKHRSRQIDILGQYIAGLYEQQINTIAFTDSVSKKDAKEFLMKEMLGQVESGHTANEYIRGVPKFYKDAAYAKSIFSDSGNMIHSSFGIKYQKLLTVLQDGLQKEESSLIKNKHD